jgi:hypothetical protein
MLTSAHRYPLGTDCQGADDFRSNVLFGTITAETSGH